MKYGKIKYIGYSFVGGKKIYFAYDDNGIEVADNTSLKDVVWLARNSGYTVPKEYNNIGDMEKSNLNRYRIDFYDDDMCSLIRREYILAVSEDDAREKSSVVPVSGYKFVEIMKCA